MLTVFGFWVVPDSVNYPLLLLAGATLYGTLSLLRKSLLFGVLATVLANSSLWYLLQQVEGMSFLEHPQFWLVPPAICVLIAAYLNRNQLDNEQMTGIRYSSAIVIYASSTTDILIHGVAAAPWLPAVLAAISITGIFVGILLQVRAFLYLGTSFLCVALFSVIWMAAVELQHTWVWWVSGIVAGILVITIFAVFEKKRDDIRHLIDHLRHWEP